MPTPTYVPLGTVTLVATDTSITFSSIPATYRDLILVASGKGTGDLSLRTRFNADSGSNYSYVYMQGGNDGVQSGSGTLSYVDSFFVSANTCTTIHQIMDYSATDKHKSVLTTRVLAASYVDRFAQRWANTSAITSMEVFASSNAYAIGSTFSLYGLVA